MLPSLTCAFVFGLALGSFVPFFPLSILVFLIVLSIGAALIEHRLALDRFPSMSVFGMLLLGVFYWALAVERSPALPYEGGKDELAHRIAGRIVTPVQQGPDRLTMVVIQMRQDDRPVSPIRIRLTWRSPERLVFQGDVIRFQAKLRAPSGSLNPGGFDYAAYLERQGIQAVATVAGVEGIALEESGQATAWWSMWNQIDRWRGRIRLVAMQSLSQPALGLYLGVIVGDRGYLEQELRDRFMATGTVHLLSISGSHLGLVAVLAFMSIRRGLLLLPAGTLLHLSRRMTATRLAAVATVPPVSLYACLAGAELATMRSLIMILVALLARWLGHEQRMFHALAIAAVVMLLHDPEVLYDISFQLSFLSVGAIALWLSRPNPEREPSDSGRPSTYARAVGWSKDAAAMSLLVTLATLPLVAWYFNQIQWMGLLTNVLAVPAMGIVLVPLGLLAACWQLLGGATVMPMASTLQWLLDGFCELIDWMSSIPYAEWHVASPSVPMLLLYYVTLWLCGQALKRKRLLWAPSLVLAMVLLGWMWSPRLWLDADRYRITFLDVGQGDSSLLELPGGQVVLIDGGATYERFDMGRGVVGPYLWNRGIRTIDHVIATHPQLDHAGGLAWVVQRFDVRNYWGTGDRREEPFFRRLQQAVASRGLMERLGRAAEDILASRDCRLTVMNPPQGSALVVALHDDRGAGHWLNNRSLVTQLHCGDRTMLFAADVEQETLARLLEAGAGPIDVLKVPHHGAMSSLHQEWIAAVKPRYALFSAGRHNAYGHPAQPVLAAYAAQGSELLRTDRDGAVWITGSISARSFQVHRTVDRKLSPVDLARCEWSCERQNWDRLRLQMLDRF